MHWYDYLAAYAGPLAGFAAAMAHQWVIRRIGRPKSTVAEAAVEVAQAAAPTLEAAAGRLVAHVAEKDPIAALALRSTLNALVTGAGAGSPTPGPAGQ